MDQFQAGQWISFTPAASAMTPSAYTPVESLIDFLAHPDTGELVSRIDDADLRRLYTSTLVRLVELRDGRSK